jgi:uncharacterized protein
MNKTTTAPAAEPTAAPVENKSSDNDRLLEAGVHALGIFTSFIGALIVYLIKKDEPTSALYKHAKEALNFQITIALIYLLGMVLTIIMIGFLITWAVWIFNIVICIVAAVKVYQNKPFKYPFSLQLVK